MRLENDNLLTSLQESSTELTKLNAENQSLIEERAMGEVDKERTEMEKKQLQEIVQKLKTELITKKCQMGEMSKRVDAGNTNTLCSSCRLLLV